MSKIFVHPIRAILSRHGARHVADAHLVGVRAGGEAAATDGERGAAGGGNGTAANRIVNAIPAVCEAPPGVLHPLDVTPLNIGAQFKNS